MTVGRGPGPRSITAILAVVLLACTVAASSGAEPLTAGNRPKISDISAVVSGSRVKLSAAIAPEALRTEWSIILFVHEGDLESKEELASGVIGASVSSRTVAISIDRPCPVPERGARERCTASFTVAASNAKGSRAKSKQIPNS